MIENSEPKDKIKKYKAGEGPPVVYEKIIQKLEADIRGHIRLEHEMKIHMDYLEGCVEKFEKEKSMAEVQVKKMQGQIESLQGKIQLIRGDRDDKDT